VKLTVEQSKRLNRMRLQGDSSDIATMYAIVYKCFQRLDMTEHMKTEADLIAQQVYFTYLLCLRSLLNSAVGNCLLYLFNVSLNLTKYM